MKKQIIHEINTLPPLPTNVIELNEFRNHDDIDIEYIKSLKFKYVWV